MPGGHPVARRFGAAALLLAVSACSSGGPTPEELATQPGSAPTTEATTAAAVIARVIEHTAQLRTVQMTFEQQMSFRDGDQLLNLGNGEVDIAGRAGDVFFDLPSGPGDPTAPDSVHLLWKGDVIYLKGLPNTPPGAVWVRMDTRQMDDVPGLESMRDLMSQATADLGLLYGAQDVEVVGPDQVLGIETTRYAFTADFATAVREIPQHERHKLKRYLRKFSTDSLEVDVWVDAEEELRRIEFPVDGHDLSGGVGQFVERIITMVDFIKFDAPVRIDLPPKSQVIDFTDAIRAQGGAGRG